MWHSSAGAMAGILLQGSGVLMSAIMLRSKSFSRVTGYSGLIANGLDLTQHLIHFALPPFAAVILWIAGPFYIVWYAMLGRDFFRLARREHRG
jgi:hypothetical protein